MSTLSRKSRLALAILTLTVVLAGCAIADILGMSKEVAVTLSGANEVPPVNTSASGGGIIFVAADKSINGVINTTGVAGTAAHIHTGAAGKNGPVIFSLTKGKGKGKGDDGRWEVPDGTKLTDVQFESFRNGELYINVHSAANKGGEIRGQLIP